MSSLLTGYEHITRDENGVAVIAGTKMRVVELVLDAIAYGWSPEELHFQHPDLSLGQIHSALGYYADHKAELDAEIEKRLAKVIQLREANALRGESPLAERLKSKGLLS
jgi:uncharacterized protein (DUF433 family)